MFLFFPKLLNCTCFLVADLTIKRGHVALTEFSWLQGCFFVVLVIAWYFRGYLVFFVGDCWGFHVFWRLLGRFVVVYCFFRCLVVCLIFCVWLNIGLRVILAFACRVLWLLGGFSLLWHLLGRFLCLLIDLRMFVVFTCWFLWLLCCLCCGVYCVYDVLLYCAVWAVCVAVAALSMLCCVAVCCVMMCCVLCVCFVCVRVCALA